MGLWAEQNIPNMPFSMLQEYERILDEVISQRTRMVPVWTFSSLYPDYCNPSSRNSAADCLGGLGYT